MSKALEHIISSLNNAHLYSIDDKPPLFTIDSDSPVDLNKSFKTLCASKGVLTITGEQRLKFLQGQVTCDTSKITLEKASFGAFCSLKGRVIANFLAFDDDQSTHLIMSQDLIDDLIAHLTKYAVFSRVTLTNASNELFVLGSNTPSASSESLSVTNTTDSTQLSISNDRCLIITSADNAFKQLKTEEQLTNEQCWNELDIWDHISWISKETSDVFLPQLLGLEEKEGLSFNKGCYTGQEIIARMKYRGQLKRQLFLVELSSEEKIEVSEGTKIDSEDKKNIGQIVNIQSYSDGHIALITLENDYISNTVFLVNGSKVELVIK